MTIPKINSGVALISVENASQVLLAKRVPVSSDGVTSFRFKVTEKMSPNAYVQVTVLQPHRNTVDHKPIRMYGVEPFSVSDKNSELHLFDGAEHARSIVSDPKGYEAILKDFLKKCDML